MQLENGILQNQPLEEGRITDEAREGHETVGDTVGCSPAVLFPRADLTNETRGQFGEVETLVDLMAYYGVENGWFIDLGCFDGTLYSNSAAFRQHGWNVVGIDASHDACEQSRAASPPFHCVIEAEVKRDPPYTLDWMIDGVGGVPKNPDILQIDVDGYDYHIWKSLKNYRPRVVCIEIADFMGPFSEGEFVPEYDAPIPEDFKRPVGTPEGWVPMNRGATLLSMSKLAREMGYQPVAVTRCNAIFVADEVIATKPLKLNLGAQGSFLPGFVNVDFITGQSCYPLAHEDGTVDEIYASHVLEHFSHRHTIAVLRDWVRVLKPDGKIRIAVPDFEKIIDPKVVPDFCMRTMYLMGGHVDKNDRHGQVFTAQSLATLMRFVGLEFIQGWESEIKDCAALPVSLNLGAIKRGFVKKENPAVVAVISQPRLTFADASNSLHRALRMVANKAVFYGKGKEPILDDLIYSGGAFWEKSLTAGIKSAIHIGADYILFTDYDSTFTPEDALALIQILDDDLTVSAAFAVQASRHHDAALVQSEHVRYDTENTPVILGHFGLTVIRAEVFRDLPHPWFWSMPNPETGEWDQQGHCDADITFWRILYEHGHKIVQANHVQAGHLVLCNKWMTDKGVAYQPVEHYRAFGRPKEATFNADALYKNQNLVKERRAAEAKHAIEMLEGKTEEAPPSP